MKSLLVKYLKMNESSGEAVLRLLKAETEHAEGYFKFKYHYTIVILTLELLYCYWQAKMKKNNWEVTFIYI